MYSVSISDDPSYTQKKEKKKKSTFFFFFFSLRMVQPRLAPRPPTPTLAATLETRAPHAQTSERSWVREGPGRNGFGMSLSKARTGRGGAEGPTRTLAPAAIGVLTRNSEFIWVAGEVAKFVRVRGRKGRKGRRKGGRGRWGRTLRTSKN